MIRLSFWPDKFEKVAQAAFFISDECAAFAFSPKPRSKLINAWAEARDCIPFARVSQTVF